MVRRLLPLAAALTLVAAGCGDDDDGGDKAATTATTANNAAYRTEVQTILGSVGTAGRELGTSVRAGASLGQVGDALEAFQKDIENAATQLEDLTPPPAAKEGQDELAAVLRDLASGVQKSIDAAQDGDRSAFRDEFTTYQRDLNGSYRRRLTTAGAKIDRALAGQ